MSSVKPLLLRFALPEKRFFIYDTLTNMFFEVDRTIFDILEFYKTLPENVIIEKLQAVHSREELEKSLGIIKEQEKTRGLFSDTRATCMSFVHDDSSFMDRYNKTCGQIILEVIQNCNLRCKYCTYSGHYSYQRLHNQKEMSWETAKAGVDWFVKASRDNENKAVTFYGGEPLLRFDLIKKVIDYAKQQGMEFFHSFTTNGTLLGNREIIDFLAMNKVSMLVSLDGPAEVHDKYRVFAHGKPTHAVIMENLERIYRLYPEYYSSSVNCISTIAYKSDIPEVFDFFTRAHGFPLSLGRLSNVDAMDTDFYKVYGEDTSGEENPYIILFEKYRQMLLKQAGEIVGDYDREASILHKLFDEDFIAIHKRCMHRHREMHMNGCCIPGQRRVFVETDGTMHACEKISNKYPLGNVHSGGFDLNRVKDFIEGYIEVSFKDCRECPIQRVCRLCFRFAMKDGIMTAERKREMCKAHINEIENSLGHYIRLKAANDSVFSFIDHMQIT
jgi:uncharacterized protein